MFHLVSFYVHFIMQYHFIILMLFAFNPLQSKMQKAETDFQQMIQARIRKFEEIEASVKLSKVCVLFECFFFYYKQLPDRNLYVLYAPLPVYALAISISECSNFVIHHAICHHV